MIGLIANGLIPGLIIAVFSRTWTAFSKAYLAVSAITTCLALGFNVRAPVAVVIITELAGNLIVGVLLTLVFRALNKGRKEEKV